MQKSQSIWNGESCSLECDGILSEIDGKVHCTKCGAEYTSYTSQSQVKLIRDGEIKKIKPKEITNSA